jgi:integrase
MLFSISGQIAIGTASLRDLERLRFASCVARDHPNCFGAAKRGWSVNANQGAGADQRFLASLIPGSPAKPFSRHTLRKRFRTACKVLGAARLVTLTIHHGRHTFISHALAGGRTLAEVRDAAGHGNIDLTSGYLHVAVYDETGVGNLFRLS